MQFTMYGIDQYIVQYEQELGPPWKAQDAWMKVSYPFFNADKIKTPTLFLGGEKDFNVPIAGGEQMYQALKSLGVRHELVIYPGQFHGLTDPELRARSAAALRRLVQQVPAAVRHGDGGTVADQSRAVSNSGMTRHRRDVLALLALTVLDRMSALGQAPAVAAPAARTYGLEPYSAERQRRLSEAEVALLEKLNRRDRAHLSRLTEVVVPDVWTDAELAYSPLPDHWPWAATRPKALVVHQPMQVFGAYESGRLVYWGPVSTGRAETPTPTACFISRGRRSRGAAPTTRSGSSNWYFNFINSRGVSFHEFDLPGRPASHACVRLLQRDAQWLYAWGEQWRLSADQREVITPGTPVVILGSLRLPGGAVARTGVVARGLRCLAEGLQRIVLGFRRPSSSPSGSHLD